MKMKKGLILGLAIMGSVLMAGCGGSEAQFGVLDANRVMTESPKIQALQTELTTKGQALTAQLQQDQASLPADQFQKKQQETYQEFVQLKKELESQVESTMKTALDEVAKEKKLSMVLYKTSVAQGGVDVTDDVLNKLK